MTSSSTPLSNIKILLLSFMLVALSAKAQISHELDQKNGFLEFKFGTSPSVYAGKIKKEITKQVVNGATVYEVVDLAYKRVLGYDVHHIRLSFVNNKLWAITIDFIEENEDRSYEFLDYKLKNIFGEPAGSLNSSDSKYFYYHTGHRWKGERTTLDLIKIQDKGTDKYWSSIYYKNNDLEKKAYNQEF